MLCARLKNGRSKSIAHTENALMAMIMPNAAVLKKAS